jgi:ketosteroid isomerase-like protein
LLNLRLQNITGKSAILLIVFFTSFFAVIAADLQSEFTAMVQAERDFAKASVEKGRREAFLTYLSKDSIVFNPGPSSGQAYAEKMPQQSTGVLDWYPEYAEISGSGEMGYTTGPWKYADKIKPDSVAYGQFNSIWQKQSDGQWKNICDFGASYPGPSRFDPKSRLSYVRGPRLKKESNADSVQESLITGDRKFSELVSQKGLVSAYESNITSDARLYRDGEFPFVGKDAILNYLKQNSTLQKWEPIAAKASAAGDLGFTYGSIHSEGKTGESYYLRVWKIQTDGNWKVVLDVNNVPAK